MSHIFFDGIENLVLSIGADYLLIIFCILNTISFTTNILLCFFKGALHKKTYLITQSILLVLTLGAFICFQNIYVAIFYLMILTFQSIIMYIPIKKIAGRKIVIKEGAKQFVKYLENKMNTNAIKSSGKDVYENAPPHVRDFQEKLEILPSINEIKSQPVSRVNVQPCVDYEHVKNVIKRLDEYNLSAIEIKQIEALKQAIIIAECASPPSPLIVQKINDGLGWLLKILSKYKV